MLSAYKQTLRDTQSPREAERRVFAQVTAALEATAAPTASVLERSKALGRNQQLWNMLMSDLSQPDNMLPKELKAQLVGLALWVDRHTAEVQTGAKPIAPLIEVNRAIIAGLMGAGRPQ